MFAITVEFLAGVAFLDGRAAGRPGVAEWPPHPDRLMMALVAAWGRANCDPSERAALEWLERQNPPSISASDVQLLPTLTCYSPVNDRLPNDKEFKKGLHAVTRGHRGRHLVDYFRGARNKERHIASVVPDSPRITYVWATDAPDDVSQLLHNIASRLTYLGSSESVATAWVDETPPEFNWVPSERGERMFRVPYAGRVNDLQGAYEAGTPPSPSGWAGYSPATANKYVVGEWSTIIPFELSGPVDLRHTVRVARAVRSCLLAACPDPVPSWVSGHSVDGNRLRDSHIGVVPLANVGHEYGDGRVLGVGLTIPANVAATDRIRCLSNLFPKPHSVGKNVTMQRVASVRTTLDPARWTRPSTTWGTITPIACHRWRKRGDVSAVLRRDIGHAGFPQPETIEVLDVSPFKGGLFEETYDAPKKFRAHAVIHWSEPVAGPVVIRAGRYMGMGFCGRLS